MNSKSIRPDEVEHQRKTNGQWARQFRADARDNGSIPWDSPHRLSREEVRRIAASIGEFQRGESSAAVSYLTRSAAFSHDTGDASFHEASMAFVAAENFHAAQLLRFMRLCELPERKSTWADHVFRGLRGRSDLGWGSRVILVAELIAQIYYPCLRAATGHPALRRLCGQIIADEDEHIIFQVQRIAEVEASCGDTVVKLREVMQRLVLFGTAVVVFASHARVLRPRHTLRSFLAQLTRRQAAALAAIAAQRARQMPAAASVPQLRPESGP